MPAGPAALGNSRWRGVDTGGNSSAKCTETVQDYIGMQETRQWVQMLLYMTISLTNKLEYGFLHIQMSSSITLRQPVHPRWHLLLILLAKPAPSKML